MAAYSVMSNHYHIILYINSREARGWSGDEIIVRWHQRFKGSMQSQQYAAGEVLDKSHCALLKKQVQDWRSRLTNISWFMRILNEKVARKANKEDDCTGRFWEGRFKSQALLDEKALMACMAYVDLNPVRAKMAATPETSAHTSIRRRCEAAKSKGRAEGVIAKQPKQPKQPKQLQRFAGNPRADMPEGLPFRLTDYLDLVDWAGRQIRDDKRGAIDDELPNILQRLEIDEDDWLYMTQNFESRFKSLVGAMHSLRAACEKLGYQRISGRSAIEALF